MRIKILKTFNGMVEGQSWRFVEGTEREVPEVPARDFIRAGYAMRAADAPAVKVIRKAKDTGRAKIK